MIDSYKWLPPSLKEYYRNVPVPAPESLPWTPLSKPLSQCRVALLTSAAVYVKGAEPPFDTEREKREGMWGDPSYRTIPRSLAQDQVGACHLHINNDDLLRDVNIVLPVHRLLEMEAAGEIGSLAPTSYSFMGFQLDTTEWQQRYGPEVARRLKDEEVDAVLLTPA